MSKDEFKKVVEEGLERNKNFMVTKIKSIDKFNPVIVIVQSDDIIQRATSYLKLTDANLVFLDTGDQIIDVLMTSNLSDLLWFAY